MTERTALDDPALAEHAAEIRTARIPSRGWSGGLC
jgi:hypothetical protein